jgi:uncharacterized protein YceH (UPF0502 family)
LLPELNDKEARVIGCLIEKSIVTPDQYPLTLNALTNACNQKSSRDPVMSLRPGEVQQTVRQLEAKHLARTDENFKSRTEKYAHRFCNSRYSNLQFDDAQLAIVCLLLLRGPQTLVVALNSLIEGEGEPMLVKLPRSPGRKDSEYMHLFSGEVDVEAYAADTQKAAPAGSSDRVTVAELAGRVSALEAEVAELKKLVGGSN